MIKQNETALAEQEGPDRTFQNMIGHLSVKTETTSYSFEILNVSQILTKINVSNERRAEGWVFYKDREQVLFFFDIREAGFGDYKKPVTIVMAEVLSHGCILQMGFIVENKDQFIKKLLNMTKEHESA
jgi:hypothetical protein